MSAERDAALADIKEALEATSDEEIDGDLRAALLDQVSAAMEPEAQAVVVDIRPTSCPNPFRPRNRGILPAAILGSDGLDVADIDPATVSLSGPGGTASAISASIEDVAGPDDFVEPTDRDDCGTAGPDGFDDLTVKFRRRDVRTALGPVARGDTVVVTISAETWGGGIVEGVDIIWVR